MFADGEPAEMEPALRLMPVASGEIGDSEVEDEAYGAVVAMGAASSSSKVVGGKALKSGKVKVVSGIGDILSAWLLLLLLCYDRKGGVK